MSRHPRHGSTVSGDRIDTRSPRFVESSSTLSGPSRPARRATNCRPTPARSPAERSSLPPLLLAASVTGFAIGDPAKQEQVINSLVDLIPGLDAVAASLVDSIVAGALRWG